MRKTRMTGGVIRVFVYREKTVAVFFVRFSYRHGSSSLCISVCIDEISTIPAFSLRIFLLYLHRAKKSAFWRSVPALSSQITGKGLSDMNRKKRLKNKIWTCLLTAALVFSMFPVSVLAAGEEGEEYGVRVNDQPVISDNAADVLGDGTVSYDSETNTLKLNGADDLTKIENQTGETFTITVAGENAVKLANSGETSLVDSDAPVVLNGEGSLTLSGTNRNSYIKCLNAQGSVTVEGMTLILTNSNDSGICCTGDITVQKGATVKGDTGYMFYATSSGHGKLTVKDSTVTAPLEGTTVSGWMSAWVNEMEFSNSTVDITAPNGIYAVGDVKISDASEVTVTASGKVLNPGSTFPGIYAGGSMTIENSTVTATSYTHSGLLSSGDMTITGGKVTGISTAEGRSGIQASGKMTITGPVTIAAETENAAGLAAKELLVQTPAEPAEKAYRVYAGADSTGAAELEVPLLPRIPTLPMQ